MRGNGHTDGFGIRRLARALAFFGFLAVLGFGCSCEEETVSGTPGAAPGAAPTSKQAAPGPPAEQAARDTARGHAAPRRSARIEGDEGEALQVPRGRSAEGTSPDAAERGSTPPLPEQDEEFNETLNDLRSADAEVRADALLDIEPEGIGIRYLTDALRDPDPEVRMAAISQLEDGESPEALHGLVSALDDPDPEVVVEAIDALEYVGDSSVIGDLELLLQHANEEVRTAAQDAIEYLED